MRDFARAEQALRGALTRDPTNVAAVARLADLLSNHRGGDVLVTKLKLQTKKVPSSCFKMPSKARPAAWSFCLVGFCRAMLTSSPGGIFRGLSRGPCGCVRSVEEGDGDGWR